MTAASIDGDEAWPFFNAVVITPVPIGLVKIQHVAWSSSHVAPDFLLMHGSSHGLAKEHVVGPNGMATEDAAFGLIHFR